MMMMMSGPGTLSLPGFSASPLRAELDIVPGIILSVHLLLSSLLCCVHKSRLPTVLWS